MAQGNLGVLFNNLRGKAGSVVFARSKDGTVIKPRIAGRNPRTPAQLAVRANLTKASGAFKNLSPAQLTTWQTYAATQTKRDPRTAKSYTPSAINAYSALATKVFQVNPSAAAPTSPPALAFVGDTITVTAAGAAGKVTFTGSAANGVNITTELLVQPLKSRNRAPQPKGYRTKAFKAFAAGNLTQDVTLAAGWYVPAYRFVNTTTGQVTGLVVLPMVQVS